MPAIFEKFKDRFPDTCKRADPLPVHVPRHNGKQNFDDDFVMIDTNGQPVSKEDTQKLTKSLEKLRNPGYRDIDDCDPKDDGPDDNFELK